MAAEERPRLVLWLPVMLGLGAAGYFSLGFEPGVISSLLVVVIVLAAGIGARRWPVLALVAALGLGLLAAQAREAMVAAPVLDHPMVAHLSGRVESWEPRPRGVRVVLGDLVSGAFPAVPALVRIVVPSGDRLTAGAAISLTASLAPPPGPSEPGESDFGRSAFFNGLGGVGFSYGGAAPALLAREAGWGTRVNAA